jgi:hypothetical protein
MLLSCIVFTSGLGTTFVQKEEGKELTPKVMT